MTDPTDPGGVGATAERTRGTRIGDSGSPVGSPLTIVLAVIAIVVGFLIFRSIDDGTNAGGVGDPSGSTTLPGGSTTTVAGGGAATTTKPAVTTAPTRTTTGATVIVANASGITGSARAMTAELESADYTLAEPTDDNSDEPLADSVVYYAAGPPAIQAVAQSVARDMGGLTVEAMPTPIPTASGDLGTATVLVMMGSDTAGSTLEDLQADAAPNVQAPDPAGTSG